MTTAPSEPAPRFTIGVLGDLEITAEDGPVDVGGPQQRLVLALLVAAAPDPMSIDSLMFSIWEDVPPPTARRTVQTYVSNLRRSAGESLIRTTANGYLVDLSSASVDAEMARLDLHSARTALATDAVTATAAAAAALARWRGPAYAGMRDIDALRPEIERLDELRVAAEETWLAGRARSGETTTLLPDLEAFAAAHPLRESTQALLMEVLAAAGRTADALSVYRRVEQALAVELGVEPSTQMKLAESRIVEGTDDSSSAAEPHQLSHHGEGLPRYLTSFVGRHTELAEVEKLVRRNRLVTLLGPGGIGKTRLAVELTEALTDHTVSFVALDGLAEGGDVETEVALGLGLHLAGLNAGDVIAAALDSGRRLLILDNCEHVAGEVKSAVEPLLSRCANLRVVATSRVTLGSSGEVAYTVPPMSIPDDDYVVGDAVRLFTERAMARNPEFELTDRVGAPVEEICRILDGLPLALELAASRMAVLTPGQLVERLRHGFAIVTDHRRDGRHSALMPTFEWSLSLLDEAELAMLRDLSVFRGSFDIDTVVAFVAGGTLDEVEALDAVSSLVDRSMLHVAPGPAGSMEYRLLVPLRELLADGLTPAQQAALRDRHLDYFHGLIEQARAAGGPSPDEESRLGLAARDDLNQALAHAFAAGRHVDAFEMLESLGRWWPFAGLHEDFLRWSGLLAEALDRLPPESRAEALLIHAAGFYFSQRLAECLTVTRRVVEMRRAAGDPVLLARVLSSQGILLYRLDRLDEAEASLTEASALVAASPDFPTDIAALVAWNHARVVAHAGRAREAVVMLESVLQAARDSGDVFRLASTLYHLSDVLLLAGDSPGAEAAATESMALSARIELRNLEWSARLYYVHALVDQGLVERAQAAAVPLVADAAKVGEPAEALVAAGRAIPDDRDAVFVLGAASRAMEQTEVAERWATRRLDQALALGRERLPSRMFELQFGQGETTPVPDALHAAREALNRA